MTLFFGGLPLESFWRLIGCNVTHAAAFTTVNICSWQQLSLFCNSMARGEETGGATEVKPAH